MTYGGEVVKTDDHGDHDYISWNPMHERKTNKKRHIRCCSHAIMHQILQNKDRRRGWEKEPFMERGVLGWWSQQHHVRGAMEDMAGF